MDWTILVELFLSILLLSIGAWNIGKGIECYKHDSSHYIYFAFGIYFTVNGIVFVIVDTLIDLGVLNINLW